MTRCTLYRYEPRGKFSRIYVAFPTGIDPRIGADKDAVWEQIKRQHFSVEKSMEHRHSYWDDEEEEQAERDSWFTHWDDLDCWDVSFDPPIFIDSHY